MPQRAGDEQHEHGDAREQLAPLALGVVDGRSARARPRGRFSAIVVSGATGHGPETCVFAISTNLRRFFSIRKPKIAMTVLRL